jgi:hypothetical protein
VSEKEKGGVVTYEEAWKRNLAAEKILEVRNGKIEREELSAVDADIPSIEYREYETETAHRVSLRLVLPPPKEPPFDENLLRAKGVAAAFVQSFVSETREGGIRFPDEREEYRFNTWDGFAVLESFVELCEALYGFYTSRGLKAKVDDVGGDFADITVEAEWRG